MIEQQIVEKLTAELLNCQHSLEETKKSNELRDGQIKWSLSSIVELKTKVIKILSQKVFLLYYIQNQVKRGKV